MNLIRYNLRVFPTIQTSCWTTTNKRCDWSGAETPEARQIVKQ